MKITRVRATPINVPLEAAYVWSYGAPDAQAPCSVIWTGTTMSRKLGACVCFSHENLRDMLKCSLFRLLARFPYVKQQGVKITIVGRFFLTPQGYCANLKY